MPDRDSLPDRSARRHFDASIPLELREEITSANAEVIRLRAEVETLRGEVMARDGVIRDRDTENETLRKFAESAAAAFHDLDYEPGYLHARAVLARTSDEEKA